MHPVSSINNSFILEKQIKFIVIETLTLQSTGMGKEETNPLQIYNTVSPSDQNALPAATRLYNEPQAKSSPGYTASL